MSTTRVTTSELATILGSELALKFIIECVFGVLHVPPGPFMALTYEGKVKGTVYVQTLDSIFSVIMMGRLYILLRIFKNHTPYTNSASYRICDINGFVPDSTFAIKCYMNTSVLFFLSIGSCACIIIFGLIVRKFEM